MSHREIHRVQVLPGLRSRELTQIQAADHLGITVRQVRRI